MYFIGIDLAWSENNYSGVAVLHDNKLIKLELIKGTTSLAKFINSYPKDTIIGVDAPLLVENINGNRQIEKDFLRDYSSKRLGVYPVNRNLLLKTCNIIAGEVLASKIAQTIGINLFEVYPHATIMNCFNNGKVLPYKRKKGRDTAFIKSQLTILQKYLSKVVKGDFFVDIDLLKGKELKNYEDKLDAIVCAYTLYHCENNPYKIYGDIFKVPL